MFVSVDIGRVRNHIPVLEEELKEAQTLVDFLNDWRKQAVLDGLSDIRSIEKHIYIASNQVLYIQQRIELLWKILDEFKGVQDGIDTLLEDANSKQMHLLDVFPLD